MTQNGLYNHPNTDSSFSHQLYNITAWEFEAWLYHAWLRYLCTTLADHLFTQTMYTYHVVMTVLKGRHRKQMHKLIFSALLWQN